MGLKFSFDEKQFDRFFSFYVLINRELTVVSLGKSLRKLIGFKKNSSFHQFFLILPPHTGLNSFDDLLALQNELVVLELSSMQELKFKGQFEFLKDTDELLFLGSPWFGSVKEFRENNLKIDDYAIHNPLVDLLHVRNPVEGSNIKLKELATLKEQKNALKGINSFIANMLNLVIIDEIVWAIIDYAISQFHLEDCVIYLLGEKNVLIQRAAYGNKRLDEQEILHPIKIKFGQGIVGKAASTAKPIIINDTSRVPDYIVDDKIRYLEIAIPILVNSEVIGVIYSEYSSNFFYSKEHVSNFLTIANLTAVKIKNALFREKRDQLEIKRDLDRKKYVNLVENASAHIYELNYKGYFTYANPNIVRLSGYSLEELKKKHYLDLVEESFKDKLQAIYKKQFDLKKSEIYMEHPVVSKNGKIHWISQNVNFGYDSEGRLEQVIVIGRDITKQKLTEIALKKSEENKANLQKTLIEEQKKFKLIVENVSVLIAELNYEGYYTYVNPLATNILGYSLEELKNKHFLDLVAKSHKDKVQAFYKNQLAEKIPYTFLEIPITNKEGEELWFGQNVNFIFNSEGGFEKTIIIGRDITEQKLAEIALKKSEEKQLLFQKERAKEQKKFKTIVEDARVFISEQNYKGDFTYANPTTIKKLGYSLEEIKKMNFVDFVEQSHKGRVQSFFQNQFTKNKPDSYIELLALSKSGKEIWFGHNVNFMYDSEGRIENIITVARDITEQKLTEIALKKSEENKTRLQKMLIEEQQKFKLIIENVSVLIYECNYKGYFTYVNPSIVKVTGYSIEELKKMHYLELITEDYKDKLNAFYRNKIIQKIATTYIEHPIISKKGKIHWVGQNVNFIFKSNGHIKNIITVGRDITEQKNAEFALKKSEEKQLILKKEHFEKQERLQMIVETARALISESDHQGYFIYVNPEGVKLSGYSLEELKKMNFLDLVEESYKDRAFAFFNNILVKKSTMTYIEFPILTKKGGKVWLGQNLTYNFKSDGNLQNVITVGRDITKQKLTEIALQKSEDDKAILVKAQIDELEKHQMIVENSNAFIYETNHKGDFTYLNPAAIKLSGYSLEKLKKMNNLDFVEESYKEKIITFYKNLFNQKLSQGYIELPAVSKDGKTHWIGQNVNFVFNSKGRFEKIIIIGRDITKQKLAEIALKKSKDQQLILEKVHIDELKKYAHIVENASEMIFEISRGGYITFVNNVFSKKTGYSLKDIEKVHFLRMVPEKFRNEVLSKYTNQTNKKVSNSYMEVPVIPKNGEVMWVGQSVNMRFNKDGLLLESTVVARDITKQKIAEDNNLKIRRTLEAIVLSTEEILSGQDNFEKSIEEALRIIGEAVEADRAHLFQNHVNENGVIIASQSFEWVRKGISPQISNPYSQDFPIAIFEDHISKFYIKEPFQIVLKDLKHNSDLKKRFILKQVKSIMIIPIFHFDNFWGYTGFTDCQVERNWSSDVSLLLKNFSISISKALEREYTRIQLRDSALFPEQNPDPVIRINNEGNIMKKNPAASKLALIEYKGQTYNNDEFYTLIASRINHKAERWTLEAVSNTINYSFACVPIHTKGYINIYGSDISKQKKFQQQIMRSQKKYRDVIDNALAAISTQDMDGNFLTANPIFYTMFGYKPKEVIGRPLSDFISPFDKMLFKKMYLQKIKEEKKITGVFQVIHKNGSVVYTLFNNFLKEEPGEEPYVIAFALDITKSVLAQKELKAAKKIAEELAEVKQNFLANMSHEIRTPMNGIIGMTRQLQKTKLNEKQHTYLNTISNASDNLLIIINDILDFSKLEAGKLSHEKIGFEPKFLIKKVIQIMNHKAEEKGLVLTNSFYGSQVAPILIGDPYRVNQILLNLVSNAIKFTERGRVDIRVSVFEENEINQLVEIEVLDTGIGMAPLFVKNIFQKFNQEDTSTARRFGGSGLGMCISKALVDLMGGEIFVESEKGKGSVFKIRMSFQKGTKADLPVKKRLSINTEELVGKKILLVDDNEMNRLVAKTILRQYKVLVTEAEDGGKAIKLMEQNTFDLVLMDIQMPELNGYEATKIIRENLKSAIPIIALTANAIKGENEKCMDKGMNDYLSKPFEEDELILVVCRWIDGAKGAFTSSNGNSNQVRLYDLSKLEAMAKGNQEFVDEMIQLFIKQTKISVSEIKIAFETGNYRKVKAIAHRIKPSIDAMGISSLKKEIREIEKNAEVFQSSDQLENLISKLDTILNEVVNNLEH